MGWSEGGLNIVCYSFVNWALYVLLLNEKMLLYHKKENHRKLIYHAVMRIVYLMRRWFICMYIYQANIGMGTSNGMDGSFRYSIGANLDTKIYHFVLHVIVPSFLPRCVFLNIYYRTTNDKDQIASREHSGRRMVVISCPCSIIHSSPWNKLQFTFLYNMFTLFSSTSKITRWTCNKLKRSALPGIRI